jgi:hypothetical protein
MLEICHVMWTYYLHELGFLMLIATAELSLRRTLGM